MRFANILTSMLVCSLISQTTFATEIYRNKDSQGRITYSDTATSGSKQIKISSQITRRLHQVQAV